MAINLSECKLITSQEYCELENPTFMGQTRVNQDGMFYMVWECKGVLYKTYNKL